MKKNNIIIIVIVLFFAVIGGYLVGRRSGRGPGGEVSLKEGKVSGSAMTNIQRIDDIELINDLKKKIKENPNDANALAYLGDIYFNLRQFQEAIKYYKKTIEINPKDIDSYNDLGLAYHYIGESEEGLRVVEEGVKIDPYFQRIWLTKGFMLATTGRIAGAREAWTKAVAIEPKSDIGKAASSFLAKYEEEPAGN
jgi:tetratricopeptide (TPR) repeat protein